MKQGTVYYPSGFKIKINIFRCKLNIVKNQEKPNKVLFDSVLLPENVANAPAILTELDRTEKNRALAFLEQSYEFFDAARSPRLSCRPLLYYYSFLNLAKVFLLLKRMNLAIAPKHGISDPKLNQRERLRFEGQSIVFHERSSDRSELFPELVTALGGTCDDERGIKIQSLLRQIPGVHRTFCKVTNERCSFLPVKTFNLIRSRNRFCVRMILDKKDKDVDTTLKRVCNKQIFKAVFKQVRPQNGKNDIMYPIMLR